MHLARDLEANLISLSPDDLEELAEDFFQQDQIQNQMNATMAKSGILEEKNSSLASLCPSLEEPEDNTPYCFLKLYFSSDKGCESRSKAAVRAILQSVSPDHCPQPEERFDQLERSATQAVILHLKDMERLPYGEKSTIFRRFAREIIELRSAAVRIFGVASQSKYWSAPEEFSVGKESSFEVPRPPNYSSQAQLYKQQELEYIQNRKSQRLKKMLRGRLAGKSHPSFLDLDQSEEEQLLWRTEVFRGNSIPRDSHLGRAVTQIAGCLWHKKPLCFEDVVAVTTRLNRNGLWGKKQELEEESTTTDKEADEQDPWEGLSLLQRKRRIADKCRSHEKQLLECIVDPATLTVTYDDVIIEDKVKESVKELIHLLKFQPHAESRVLLERIRLNGALFYGPPGTGKTLLCKAIASEGRYNMLSLNPSNIQNKFVGETEKLIAAAFSVSAKLSPCVLFIDEADALFYRRSSQDRSWQRSMLNQFLYEMDGLKAKNTQDSPFVIIGTNRPGDLDDAFLRRLPHKVFFPLPNADERAKILRVLLHEGDIDPQVDLDELAKGLSGFSGSDIRNLCGHASLIWFRQQIPNSSARGMRIFLEQHHFDEALAMTGPTVSEQSMKDLERFAKTHDAGYNKKLSQPRGKFNAQSEADPSPESPESDHEFDISSSSIPILSSMNFDFQSLKVQSPENSLGRLVEDICGTPASNSSSNTIADNIIRGLTNWYRLQGLFWTGIVERFIAWDQRYSYQLIFDWWTATIDDPEVPAASLAALIGGSKSLKTQVKSEIAVHGELLLCIQETYAMLGFHGSTSPPSVSWPEYSDYNKALWKLFIYEFANPGTYDAAADPGGSIMRSIRRDAAIKAYCRQASLQCSNTPSQPTRLRPEARGEHILGIIFTHQASDPHFPRVLSRGPLIRACPWLDQHESASPHRYPTDGLESWPRYLWDITKRCTIDVHHLNLMRPAYTTISHTWGRWAKIEEEGYPLPGGLEYRIPYNDKFDVTEIPNYLEALKDKISTEYVWFDLVCIPQGIKAKPEIHGSVDSKGDRRDILKPEDEQVQLNEIARQASIFRHAAASIAWFHDVEDLSCLRGLFYWFSLSMLSPTDQIEEAKTEVLKSIINPSTGLLEDAAEAQARGDSVDIRLSATGTTYENERAGRSWFTSLWTLQEVCLRPDMWIAVCHPSGTPQSKQHRWEILCTDDGSQIPFNGFVCLYKKALSMVKQPGLPDPSIEVSTWCQSTGLGELLELSQIDIIRLGERRQCKEGRAQAIMSAIGATKWFDQVRDKQYEPETDAILGKYPRRFIEEVRSLIPGEFFATYCKRPHSDAQDKIRIHGGFQGQLDGKSLAFFYQVYPFELRGSLLPFSSIGHMYVRNSGSALDRVDFKTHDSVKSWLIETGGSVEIKEACVLSSSMPEITQDCQVPIDCHLFGFERGGYGDEPDEIPLEDMMARVDLHKWTKSRSSEIHLVVIMYQTFVSNKITEGQPPETRDLIKGIVLRGEDNKQESPTIALTPRKLVKIGIFAAKPARTISLPDTTSVNWIVL
ncbi:hypothetical protein BJ166DRAFT_65726 [Pestalotiopsis sp. NC0098]|nr:hypothetical protein BJ166DRAFT_65726 [Pestalotiopsis sp. NC0098]